MTHTLTKYKLQVIKEKEYENNFNNLQNIGCPYDLLQVCLKTLELSKEPEEVFGLLTLDTKNNITGYFEVSRGSINCCIAYPREIFKRAMLQNASTVIVVHNHPSGDSEPSKEDIVLTNRLNECGKVLGIKLLDHIIVGDEERENYYSFKEEGQL
ncbi:MAG TPA: DNA repair protein RadC [Clostridiales bacterium]|nr:DNA repair protein RadC [Clostridiales bacterium]